MEKTVTSEEDLTAVYTKWLAEKGYDPMSADELRYELYGTGKDEDIEWLNKFIEQWERAVA